jgi:purine-binding chemotaxis protein CheW
VSEPQSISEMREIPSAAPVVTESPVETEDAPLDFSMEEQKFNMNQDSSESTLDFDFIVDELKSLKKFYVTDINSRWVKSRFESWIDEKGNENSQFTSDKDADEFLKSFYSESTATFWTESYAQRVFECLPDNSAKQIIVWNPGCGQGFEAYSLACILKQKYPTAKVRIYAHDIDLLAVSNATMINVPNDVASDWYAPFVTQKANGEYTFKQDIKDCIMFEYHDCKNSNTLPMVDLIFARDTLSFLDEASQKNVISDFMEKMKGNAIAIIGENEAMPLSFNFREQNQGTLYAYSKD